MRESAGKIFIYGPPGSGKSAIGSELAEKLKLNFSDLDGKIESDSGKTIEEIFESEGEAHFRSIESKILGEAIQSDSGVIALGGGALLSEVNRSLAEKYGQIVCLNANREKLLDRVLSEGNTRPLLSGDTAEKLGSLLNTREQHYAGFKIQLDTSFGSISELTWDVMSLVGHFFVSGMGNGYDVLVGENYLERVGIELRNRSLKGPVAIVSDDNVARHYLEKVLASLRSSEYQVYPIVIPAGEENKNIHTLEIIWNKLLDYDLERGSTVIALGGGVVGDLAGFAASTFKRGIHWVVLPTSLLAMVDACLGGKTGADLTGGKNMIGAFYSPKLVVVDLKTLQSLPEAEIRNGMAEVIKHGLIGDGRLLEDCQKTFEDNKLDWRSMIAKAMAVKIRIIERDPLERGERAVLNLGHTLGHALETASNYRIKHGEAISIGMVQAAKASEYLKIGDPGVGEKIRETLENTKLPHRIPEDIDKTRLVEIMNHDKKKDDGKVKVVLPVRVGEVRWGVEIDDLSLLVSGGES